MAEEVVEHTTKTGTARATPAGERRWSVGLLVGFLAVGVTLFALALVQAFAWNLMAYVLGACVAGAAAALVLNDVLAQALDNRQRNWSARAIGAVSVVITLAGVVVLVIAVLREWVVVAAVDVLLLSIGLIGCNLALKGNPTRPPTDRWLRALAAAAGLLVVAIAIVASSWSSWVAWVALIAWFVELTLLKLQVGPWLDDAETGQLARRVTLVAMALAVAGAGLLALGAWRANEFWVVLGVTFVIGGLSVAGIGGSRLRLAAAASGFALAAGVAGVAASFVWMWLVVGGAGVALVLTVLVVIIGTWFVFRGEAFIAVVLIGGVTAWALVDRNDATSAVPADAPQRIIGLGDSFISGEGAENFLRGTNTLGEDRNECRRSPGAYTFLLAGQLGHGAVLLACSGAETEDVLSIGQMPDSPPEIAGGTPQIEALAALDPHPGDVVLLSIGGNDVGFSDIVKACLLPSPCDDRRVTWLPKVDDLYPILVDTYRKVREAAGGAVVIVVPYPNFVPADSCGLGLSQREHVFVQEFIGILETTIERAAAAAGVFVFDGSQTVFAADRLCDPKPAANHLQLRPPDGPQFSRFHPGKWAHGPMHPNERGHRLLAAALEPIVQQALESGATNPAPVVESGATPVTTGSKAQAETSVEEIADDEWIADRLYETALRLLAPIALALVFSVVAATGFVHRSNRVARFLAP
jgi:lysophospholipase L1-like esterase